MSQILKENEVAVDRERLKELMQEIESQDADIKQFYEGAIKLMDILGMVENGVIKKEILDEGVSMRAILSGVKPTLGLVMTAGVSKKAEEKLTEKFAFFKELVPLFDKYGQKLKS